MWEYVWLDAGKRPRDQRWFINCITARTGKSHLHSYCQTSNLQAAKFCADLRKQEGHQAWIVGIVENGNRDAKVIDRPRIIEVITGEDGSVQVLCDLIRLFHHSSFPYSCDAQF